MTHPVTEALRRGWSVIPTMANKKPPLKTWKEFQQHPATLKQLQTWRSEYQPAGFAVVTGAVSHLVVIDFDGEKGLQTMRKYGIKPHRKTGSGGFHWYVEHPGFPIPTLTGKNSKELGRLLPGLDVRGDGGYAVFAGRNTNGRYESLRPMEPDRWEGPLIETILPLIRQGTPTASASKATHSPPITSAELAERILKDALEMAHAGQGRNAAGFWLACQIRDNGYSESEAAAALLRYSGMVGATNTKGQKESYTQSEALASVRQAYRTRSREPWSSRNASRKTKGQGLSASAAETAAGIPPGAARIEKETKQKKWKNFQQTPEGLFFVEEETDARTFVCSSLRVDAYTRDAESESWGRLLVWTDRAKREHSWAMPMNMLAGDGTALRETLLNGGVLIGTGGKARQLLLQFIQSEKPSHSAVCVPSVGWYRRTFVFPDSAIPADAAERIIYQTASRGEHFYNTAGTLEDWRESIGRRCAGNSRLVFAVSAAFAGPLLRPLNVEGGGFHLVGTSSSGKSTVQWVAGSVCGGGHGAHGFARSWRFTQNALESMAELHNDGLLILDEIREIPEAKELDSIVYMLANGSGKGRMNKSMTAQRTLNWQLLILSSGEIKLSEYAAASGARIKAGAEVRLLNIPADAGASHGVFEELHGAENARIFAEHLKAAAAKTYGTPLRAFLDGWIRDWDSHYTRVAAIMADFIKKELPPGAAPEVGRGLRRVALVAAAGELATSMGITSWEPGEALSAARRCFQDWLTDRGGIGQADMEAGIRQVRAFFEANGSARFQSVVTRMDSGGTLSKSV